MSKPRFRRNDRVVFRRLDEGSGAVLLHLETAAYRHLNEVGALIWTLLEGEPTRDELVEAIRLHITDPPDRMSAELDVFLEALRERGLIEMATAD
jgi:hypothetical protein